MDEKKRSQLSRKAKIVGLPVQTKLLSTLIRRVKKEGLLLSLKHIKPVMVPPKPAKSGEDVRILLLSESLGMKDLIQGDKVSQWLSMFIKTHEISPIEVDIDVGYHNMSMKEALLKLLPSGVEIPTSFETIGHIGEHIHIISNSNGAGLTAIQLAHVNLLAEQLPYKSVIGDVLKDKNPRIRTVVNKISTIDNVYRTSELELIAGESDFVTSVSECGCVYEMDFRKVYWNSKLQAEHTRMVANLSSGDVVCDMFAGIGPFALPAAKKGCKVYANDINPSSIEYLRKNATRNKIEEGAIVASNMDAREFMKSIHDSSMEYDHAIMNLPNSAVQFLDVFVGCMRRDGNTRSSKMPRIHCYLFAPEKSLDICTAHINGADAYIESVIVEQISQHVRGVRLKASNMDIRLVRSVSPSKCMYYVGFQLPEEIACMNIDAQEDTRLKRESQGVDGHSESKKRKKNENS